MTCLLYILAGIGGLCVVGVAAVLGFAGLLGWLGAFSEEDE